jgi:hypothetical protein
MAKNEFLYEQYLTEDPMTTVSTRRFKDKNEREEEEVLETMARIVEDKEWNDDPALAAKIFLDGVLLGFTDEIAETVPAYLESLETGRDFSEIYSERLTIADAENQQFYEDFPEAAAALSIGGALVSPATYLGGAGVQAARGALLAGRLANAGRGAQIAATTGLAAGAGALEGALAGAGTSVQGQRAEGALEGAAMGAGAGLAGEALVSGVKRIAKRRVAQELGTEEDFVPLVFTESGAAGFYRDIVSKSFGGKGAIVQQAQRIVNKVDAAKVNIDDALETNIQEAKRRGATAISVANKKVKEAEVVKKDLETLARMGDPAAKVTAKNDVAAAKAEVIHNYDATVNAAESLFRQKAVESSAPALATKEQITELQNEGIRLANADLDSLWSTLGFKSAKDKTDFTLSVDATKAKLKSLIQGDTEASVYLATKPDGLSKWIETYLDNTVENSTITGTSLVNLRSEIGKVINAMPDGGNMSLKKVVNGMQNYFDDTIEQQLEGNALQSFVKDRSRWAHRATLDSAITKASVTSGRKGEFTPEEWLQSVRQFGKKSIARGKGLLQQEADEVGDLVAKRDSFVKAQADKEARKIMDSHADKLRKQSESFKKSIADANKELAKRQRVVKTTEARADNKLQHGLEVSRLRSEKKRIDNSLTKLKELMPRENPSIFESIAADGLLGASLASRGAAAILTGTGAAKLLSTESAQRFITGQTAFQNNLQRAIDYKRGGVSVLPSVIRMGSLASGTGDLNKEPLLPEGTEQALRKADLGRRAVAYDRLQSAGKLDILRQNNPEVFNLLQQAKQDR